MEFSVYFAVWHRSLSPLFSTQSLSLALCLRLASDRLSHTRSLLPSGVTTSSPHTIRLPFVHLLCAGDTWGGGQRAEGQQLQHKPWGHLELGGLRCRSTLTNRVTLSELLYLSETQPALSRCSVNALPLPLIGGSLLPHRAFPHPGEQFCVLLPAPLPPGPDHKVSVIR